MACACLATTRESAAFCRTLTGNPDGAAPVPGCPGRGVPIYWRSRCVGYSIDRLASRRVSFDVTQQIVSDAFSRWGQSACPTSSGPSRVSIDVRDLGEVACGKIGYNPDGENQNVILFQEDVWPHGDGGVDAGDSSTLGVTTVQFNKRTGEIIDADMEINTFTFSRISTADVVSADGYDLRSIVVHEAGHFLGLAHSIDKNATMFASYDAGESKKRYPKLDDVLGLCSAYPPDGTRPSGSAVAQAGTACNPLPRRGVDRSCQDVKSCSTFGGSDLPIGAGLGLWALARMRRMRKRHVA
jgi:Matrixin